MKTLLDGYLARFSLAPVMGEAELAHTLLPTDDVVSSYVVEAAGGLALLSCKAQAQCTQAGSR